MTRERLMMGCVAIALVAIVVAGFFGQRNTTGLRGQVEDPGHCNEGVSQWMLRVVRSEQGPDSSSCRSCNEFFNNKGEESSWFMLVENKDEEGECISGEWVTEGIAPCSVEAGPDEKLPLYTLTGGGGSYTLSANAYNQKEEYFSVSVPKDPDPLFRTSGTPFIGLQGGWDGGSACRARNVQYKLYPIINQGPLASLTSEFEIKDGWTIIISDASANDIIGTVTVADPQGIKSWSVTTANPIAFAFTELPIDEDNRNAREGNIILKDLNALDGSPVELVVSAEDNWGQTSKRTFNLEMPPPFCGDGSQNQDDEECDDGSHCADRTPCTTSQECEGHDVLGDTRCIPRTGGGCNPFCKIEGCGNTVIDPGEQCDDGRHCANGMLCTSKEECKNTKGPDKECTIRADDGCSVLCQYESCGDGVVQTKSLEEPEQCDDGGVCTDENNSACDTDAQCPENSVCLGALTDFLGLGRCVYIDPQTGQPVTCTKDDEDECEGIEGFEHCEPMGQDGCSAECKKEAACCPTLTGEHIPACRLDEPKFCPEKTYTAESCEKCGEVPGICMYDQGGLHPFPFARILPKKDCMQPVSGSRIIPAVWISANELPPDGDLQEILKILNRRWYIGPENPNAKDKSDSFVDTVLKTLNADNTTVPAYCAIPIEGSTECVRVQNQIDCLQQFGTAYAMTKKLCEAYAYGKGLKEGENPGIKFLPTGLIPGTEETGQFDDSDGPNDGNNHPFPPDDGL